MNKKIHFSIITILLCVNLILFGFTFSITIASADVGGDSIPCYSVLKRGLVNNYRAVECSSCTSKKCSDYYTSGHCTRTINSSSNTD